MEKTNIGLIAGLKPYDGIGRETLLLLIHYIAQEYTAHNKDIRNFLLSVRLHIVPMVMVDDMDKAVVGDCDGESFMKNNPSAYNVLNWWNEVCMPLFLGYFAINMVSTPPLPKITIRQSQIKGLFATKLP